LSEFVKDVIMAALGGVTGAEILARIAKAAIIILAIFMILDQLQIAEDIVATAFARPTAKKAVPGAGRPVFPASDEESLHGSGRCLYPVRRRTCSMDRTLDPLILEAIARTVSSRPEIAAVYVYGSAARGEATPLSDVDLALLFVEDQSERERRELLAQITGDLARHGAGPRLDVRDFEDLPLTVQGRVLAEGALVQSNDDVRRVRFETLVRMQYFDFLPFHRRDIEEGLHFLRRRFGG
ncbi:MAG: type VII toxin-antitoxin system MntA family adenylyltransferase antitoxin, partial [Gemmatimonadota bacterium]